jgi:hypothetical protein
VYGGEHMFALAARSHQVTPPAHQDAPPAHQDAPPAHQDAPPAHQDLQALAERVRPIAASSTRLLPVLPPIAALLPDGGLRRGTVIGCIGPAAPSLAMALAAGPSAAGSWCATVGMDEVGVLAAAGYGLELERLAVVRVVPAEWAVAVAALVDGLDLVVLAPPRHAKPAAARTLAARVRDRGAVVLVVGGRTGFPTELELAVEVAQWCGLAEGTGRLQSRRVTVVARGHGAAARPVRQELWLPTAAGKVAGA